MVNDMAIVPFDNTSNTYIASSLEVRCLLASTDLVDSVKAAEQSNNFFIKLL